MRRIVLIIFSMLALLSTPAIAGNGNGGGWTVTQRSGDARVVRPGLQPASVTVNQALTPGDVIVTGASGRATLARGADYIVVAPHSQMRLPMKAQKAGFTAIIQDLGTLLYKVRHTGVPHFSVDTPMLAAVVKGTTFTVVVENGRSAVQVIDGAVEVTAADGGMQSLVNGGRTVFIDRANPRQLITADAVTLGKPSDTKGEVVKISGSEGESLLSVTAATAGQVRIEAPKVEAVPAKLVTAATVSAQPDTDVIAPVTDVVSDVVAPVTDAVTPVVAPVTDVLAPVVAPVSEVIAPVVAPITEVIAPVVAPVTQVIAPVVAPVVAPITQVIAPVVAPVTQVIAPVVAPVVAPISQVIAPVVAPVIQVIAPVIAPVTQVVAPVVAPVTQVVLPLLGL